MPIDVLIPNLLSIILQYSLVILIYYFLFRVIKMVYLDLRKEQHLLLQPAGAPGVHDCARVRIMDSGNSNLEKSLYYLGETFTIGRDNTNDIVINDGFVSHDHACITKYQHDYWLTDLQSTNRTYLNGQAVLDEVALHNGDVIKIGTVTLKFER